MQMTSSAIINLPNIDNTKYASGYRIFYRIYLSIHNTESSESPNDKSSINPALLSDFNFLDNYTNVSNNTLVTSSNTFSSRNYYELDFSVDRNGGKLEISSSSGTPLTVSHNDNPPENMKRSLILQNILLQVGNLYFRNTTELCSNINEALSINADVAPLLPIGAFTQYSYAAMYIVTIGQNPETFNRIFSKPTFIGVFKLPEY